MLTFAFQFCMNKQEIKPYGSAANKKLEVERMFDKIAPRYDFLNRLLSFGIDVWWRKKALSYLKVHQPQKMLDVATGTADVALMASKMLKPFSIVGIDIANQMLDIGREKIEKAKLNGTITLETGDSENLRFADEEFDAVTVAFGVRNFENLEKGLSEMHRVLKKGGHVVILEFSQPAIFPFKQLYHSYFKYVLPLIGRLTSQDPRAYTYLYESSMAFPQGIAFQDILKKIGYQPLAMKRLTLGICSIYFAKK